MGHAQLRYSTIWRWRNNGQRYRPRWPSPIPCRSPAPGGVAPHHEIHGMPIVMSRSISYLFLSYRQIEASTITYIDHKAFGGTSFRHIHTKAQLQQPTFQPMEAGRNLRSQLVEWCVHPLSQLLQSPERLPFLTLLDQTRHACHPAKDTAQARRSNRSNRSDRFNHYHCLVQQNHGHHHHQHILPRQW